MDGLCVFGMWNTHRFSCSARSEGWIIPRSAPGVVKWLREPVEMSARNVVDAHNGMCIECDRLDKDSEFMKELAYIRQIAAHEAGVSDETCEEAFGLNDVKFDEIYELRYWRVRLNINQFFVFIGGMLICLGASEVVKDEGQTFTLCTNDVRAEASYKFNQEIIEALGTNEIMFQERQEPDGLPDRQWP